MWRAGFWMERISGPEVTFVVHSRPKVADTPSLLDPPPLESRFGSVPSITAAADASHHRDTFLGDLAFLVRFAFGRY